MFITIGVLIMLVYPLTEKVHARMVAEVAERRAARAGATDATTGEGA